MNPLVLAAAALQAVVVAALARPLLPRLPAPVDEPDSDPYRPLATARFAAAAGLLTLAAGLVTGLLLPPGLLPAWVGLNTVGVLLACIDARTTFLPRVLTRAGGVLVGLGVAASAWWSADPWLPAQAAAGALAGWALFWLFWRFGEGFGFGDVRLAALVGGTAGAVAGMFPLLALLAGALTGAAWGVVSLLRGRRSYPYGPFLVIGPYLALIAVSGWVGWPG